MAAAAAPTFPTLQPASGAAVRLAGHLRDLRAASGLSFQLLSERSYIDPKYLHDLETGKKARPSRDVLIRLGFGLGLELAHVDELLTVAGHLSILPRRPRVTDYG